MPIDPSPGGDPRESPRSSPRSAARSAQIIYGALMLGLATFGGIVAFAPAADGPAVDGSGPSVGLLMFVAGALTVSMAIPAVLFSGRAVRRSAGAPGLAADERTRRYLTGKLFVAALIEGPGLIWGIIALLSGELLPLAGLAFSIFALGVVFPREDEWRDATGLR